MISIDLLRPAHSHSEAEPGCPRCESVSAAITECGHCGTSVDADAVACPACGRGEIVRYII